jgi:indolepyruvate ferredoxin oxidoreductase alpha subunit
VPRPPQMCPGCGHRSAFHAVKQAIESDTITVADIGCHSLGGLPPYNMGEVLLCMGHSVSTGAGLAVHNDSRKVVAFLGDSTMFHAALPGIINAIIYNHNVTLILLDNGTTAMTGHQARAGTGEVGDKIPIIPLLEALGVQKILDVDAYNQRKLIEHVQEANAHQGFAVVIARHPCMLKFTRESRAQRPELKLPKITVNPDQAADALPALEEFGCPTFQRTDDDLVGVSEDLCIGCGSCIMTAKPGTLKLERPQPPPKPAAEGGAP